MKIDESIQFTAISKYKNSEYSNVVIMSKVFITPACRLKDKTIKNKYYYNSLLINI